MWQVRVIPAVQLGKLRHSSLSHLIPPQSCSNEVLLLALQLWSLVSLSLDGKKKHLMKGDGTAWSWLNARNEMMLSQNALSSVLC